MALVAKKMSLSFASTTCSRCGGVRLLANACPDCGARPRPREVQPDVVRRQAVLKEFDEGRDDYCCDASSIPRQVEAAMGRVGALTKSLQDALSSAAAVRPGAATELVSAFAELDAFVQVWTRRHPRPHTNRARAFGRSLVLLQQGFEVFTRALAARSIHQAQTIEREGQALIDAGTDAISKLREIASSEDLLSLPDQFNAMGLKARAAGGGDQPLELLDARLQMLAGRSSTEVSVGLGLNLSMFRHMMLACLDLEECLAVTRVAEESIGHLAEICSDPWWQRRHGVVMAQFSSATFKLSRIEEETDLEAVGTVLQLVMQCRDGVIRHCLATLLADDPADYRRLSKSPAGGIIKRSAEWRPGLLLDENLSPLLRHAGAHFDYDIEGGNFVSHHERTGDEIQISIDDFLDHVLGYLQTSVSLIVAIISTIGAQAIDLEISRHTPERDLLATMEVLLGFCGYSAATVSRDGDTLLVTAAGDITNFATPIAGIATVAMDRFQAVRGEITGTDGVIGFWESDTAPFHTYQQRPPAASEADETLAAVSLMSTVRINSESAWSSDQWAAISMHLLKELPSLTLRERVLLVKRLRTSATTAGQAEVATALTAILKAVREPPASTPSIPTAFMQTGSLAP